MAARLRKAAKRGDLAALRAALARGVDVEEGEVAGFKPLHLAAGGHLIIDKRRAPKEFEACVRALIAAGANVNARNVNARGKKDYSSKYKGCWTGKYKGWTPLHCAAYNGRTACLEALLAAGAEVSVYDDRLRTPLHHASRQDHAACVRALISKGGDVNCVDRIGHTPFSDVLMPSCLESRRRGHNVVKAFDILEILLRAGADPNGRTKRSKSRIREAYGHLKRNRRRRTLRVVADIIRRRRATLIRVFSGKVPTVISAHIASFDTGND